MLACFNNTHLPAFIKRHVYILMCLLVTTCGPTDPKTEKPISASSTIADPANAQASAQNLTIPPDLLSGGGGENASNGLDDLKGMKGVKVDQLFSENISDEGRRIDRLENVVTDLYREMETIKPSIIRLVAIEKDMQDLITMMGEQSQVPAQPPELSDEASVAADEVEAAQEDVVDNRAPEQSDSNVPVKEADDVAQADDGAQGPQNQPAIDSGNIAENTEEKAAISLADRPALKDIRVGEHSEYTRIVLEVGTDVDFQASFDSNQNVLTIVLSALFSNQMVPDKDIKNDLIKDYSIKTQESDRKTVLAFTLSKSIKILKTMGYYDESTSFFKIIIDVSP